MQGRLSERSTRQSNRASLLNSWKSWGVEETPILFEGVEVRLCEDTLCDVEAILV